MSGSDREPFPGRVQPVTRPESKSMLWKLYHEFFIRNLLTYLLTYSRT